RRALVVHYPLGSTMARDRLLKGLDHHVRALGPLVDAVTDDVPRVVVDYDEREDRGAVDVPMDEVAVPQVTWPDRLVPLIVRLALHLRRSIAVVFHHAARGVDRDLDLATAELVDDLARAEARVLVPLVEDLAIALRLDVLRRGSGRRRRAIAL